MSAFIAHAHDSVSQSQPAPIGWLAGTQKLSYRGPAGTKELRLPGLRFALANRENGRRRSDIHQPIVVGSEEIVVAFDGRLHDPATLAGRLGIRRPSTLPSDAELVARAYLRHGNQFLSHLRGEYALVVYDPSTRRTIAARDTLGLRILYWARTSKGVFISNELPAIRAAAPLDDALDRTAIADFLMHGRLDFFDKSRTPFAGIHAVEPGFAVFVNDGEASTKQFGRFADLLDPVSTPRPREIPEAFRALMREVIGERMDANHVLIPLSGGLDSTTIAATAMHCFRTGTGRAQPFAITSLASSSDPERPFAELAAAHIGIDHSIIFLDDSRLLSPPEAHWYPSLDFFGAGNDERALGAPPKHEMTLFGSAGDNLIYPERTSWMKLALGYGLAHTRFARDVLAQQKRSLPFGTGLGTQPGKRRSRVELDNTDLGALPIWLQPSLVTELKLRERWNACHHWRPPEPLNSQRPNAQLWLQWPNWFPSARPVNPRLTPSEWSDPFLDHRVISFVFALPVEPWMHRKHLLRAAGKGILPDALLHRPKSPAGNYIAPKIKALHRNVLEEWALSRELEQFVDRAAIPIIDIDKEGLVDYVNFRPLMLQRWFSKLGSW